MRPALTLLLWVVLVGGLAVYMNQRTAVQNAPHIDLHTAGGQFAMEVTTTFPLEPDPFALRNGENDDAQALVVRVNGRDVLRRTERVEAGLPIRVESISGLTQGENEVYVEANPPLDMAGKSQAVRVRVLQDASVIADKSLWSDQGNKIAAAFGVRVETPHPKERDAHGH
ncbi:MAG: hypothetical protein LDL33_05080 [Desulfomonile sp.]|nr:hypothetical protein [Desulfomonile sp.]